MVVCLVAAGVCTFLACQDAATSPDASVALARDTLALFQSDSLRYSVTEDAFGYSAQIGVVFTNRTARTAYFVNCNGATSVSLQKLVNGQWQRVWSPPIPACLSPPIEVLPGANHRTQLHVSGGRPGGNVLPEFSTTDVNGTYRVVWHQVVHDYLAHPPWGEPLAPENTVSNRFTLTLTSP